jgi:hypothetical protein
MSPLAQINHTASLRAEGPKNVRQTILNTLIALGTIYKNNLCAHNQQMLYLNSRFNLMDSFFNSSLNQLKKILTVYLFALISG